MPVTGLDIEELLEEGQRNARAHDRDSHPPHADNKYEKDGRRHGRDEDGDDHMKDDGDKGSANGSGRSRLRHPDSDEDRRNARRDRTDRSSREHDRSHNRDRARDSDDHHRRSGRGRSRSPLSDRDRDHYRPSGRRDDRDRDRDRDSRRDRSRDRRSYRDDRSRRDDRDRVRDSPRSSKQKTPEPTDDERDRRTVFVQQLAARLRTKELQAFFSQVGEVKEAQIVKDRVSGRSKGVGYVEFKEEESVQKAIALTGQKLLGIPIIAQLTEAEKNRQARNTEGMPTQSNGIPFHRLYVGNIHFSVTEDDLTQVFEPFGELEFVQLQKEEMGRSKGYGFVQFVNPTHAKTALQDMNGFEIAGRPIRVGLGNDKFTPETTANLLSRFQNQQGSSASQFQGSQFSGSGGRGAHAGGNTNFDRASGRDEKGAGGASALDDSDVGGVNFNNFSRDSLMKKLARVEEPVAPAAAQSTGRSTRVDARKPVANKSAPSRCVVIKNAYNEAEETEPNWDKELEEDFRDECSAKYGAVAFVGLFRDSADGEIYVKFKDVTGGDNALKGLNGRFFGGRTLTAQPVVDAIFNMNFPKAANV